MTGVQRKIIWALFGIVIVISLLGASGLVSGHNYDLFITYVPLALVLLHACWTMTTKRGVPFLALAAFAGFIAETVSLNYGTLFGGDYKYNAGANLLGVPLSIIVYWAIFIYLGYWLVTSFLLWLGKNKPSKQRDSLKRLIPIVVLDGLAVMAIDLLMDPVQVKAGVWSWPNGGPYFGVPVGNFVGWFAVTILVTGIFRSFEYYHPIMTSPQKRSLYILPVLGYLLIGINFLIGAIRYSLLGLVLIGIIIVVLPALANLWLFVKAKQLA